MLQHTKNWQVDYCFTREDGALQARVCRCSPHQLDQLLELQQRVWEQMPDQRLFVPSTRQELAESLQEDVCIAVYAGSDWSRLAAFSVLVRNRLSPRNLGGYLNFDLRRCQSCASYETTVVDPDYRGYGMQHFLIRARDRIAAAIGATEALVTVSPHNRHSLQNLRRTGFAVAARKPLYAGLDRFIMVKRLTEGNMG